MYETRNSSFQRRLMDQVVPCAVFERLQWSARWREEQSQDKVFEPFLKRLVDINHERRWLSFGSNKFGYICTIGSVSRETVRDSRRLR